MSAVVKGGYADTSWGQVHYRVSGDRGPWIGLFHESPLSSRVFDPVLSMLGEQARVVAFDTPGYGASDAPPSAGYEIPDYAAVIFEAAIAIGMENPVFAGVHTGASIAMEVAKLMPSAGVSLSGVALLESAEREEFLASWNPVIPIDLEGSQFDWAVERYKRIWPGLDASMLHLACVEVLRVAERYEWGYKAAFRHDPTDTLAALDIPVLLLSAEFDLLAKHDEKALAVAKDARLSVIPGLQGQPHIRSPREFSEQLLQFAHEATKNVKS